MTICLQAYGVCMEVQHREKSKRIIIFCFVLIVRYLHSRPQIWLGNDEVGQSGEVEEVLISVEQLFQELLKSMKIYLLRIKPLEINVKQIRVLYHGGAFSA